MAPSSVGLRGGLDRDAYQVVKKLEEASGGRPFKTVHDAYDAVKRSNSSLSRQKKRPLEDALDRVLQVRQRERRADQLDDEAASDSDADAAMDVDDAAMDVDDAGDAAARSNDGSKPDERFLLNRQMTRHWNVTPVAIRTDPAQEEKQQQQQPTRKKRRVVATKADDDGRVPPKDAQDEAKSEAAQIQKRTARPRHEVEHDLDPPRMAGLGDTYLKLVRQARDLLLRPQLYDKLQWRRVPGIVLAGPPGTGKRTLIRALAADLRVAVINLTPCLEEPERVDRNLAEAFDAAAAAAPCILCLEQLDLCMARPGSPAHTEHQQRALSLLQRQIRRLRARGLPVLAMATTARPVDVNPVLFSLGLFEQTVQLRVPDGPARLAILGVITDGISLGPDVRLDELAKMTHGFVGADLVHLVQRAITVAAERFGIVEDPTSIWGLYPNHSTIPSSSSLPATTQDIVLPSQTPLEEPETVALPDDVPLVLDDFRAALRDFVPSLRKEGFTVVPSVSWDQVGALAAVREQLHTSIIGPIRHPDLYRSFGLRRPAGCLLWGPPGCGKTLVAQAVAHEAQASFILISGPELLNKYVGESERAVRELFARARSSTPCILFFDEMDSVAPRRDGSSSGSTTSDAGARVVNALLAELDGAQDRAGVYVMGTTNRPDAMDPAMLRPGRLSVRLFVDLPTAEERVDILAAIHRTCRPDAPDAERRRLPAVARDPRCDGFSGADLGGLHTKAAECALRRFLRAGGGVGCEDGVLASTTTTTTTTTREIGEEDWEAALAVTTRSVLNPDVYRRLHARLAKGTS